MGRKQSDYTLFEKDEPVCYDNFKCYCLAYLDPVDFAARRSIEIHLRSAVSKEFNAQGVSGWCFPYKSTPYLERGFNNSVFLLSCKHRYLA